MGQTLSTALEDCNVREVPEYIKSYFHKDGEETFMVYQPVHSSDVPEFRVSYSGPSRTHLRDDYDSGAPKFEYASRDEDAILSGMVDLCADGIENRSIRRPVRMAEGGVSGSSMYESVTRRIDHWEEAARITQSTDLDEHKIVGSESQSTASGPSTASSVAAIDQLVDEIVDTYPEGIRKLMNSNAQTSRSNTSDSDTNSEMELAAGDRPETTSRPESESNSPVSDTLAVCRQEESKLLKLLTVIVHPFELEEDEHAATAPEGSKWYLVESDWFRKWTSFLKGNERPGSIDNSKLVNEDGEPWPGLEPGRNYVAVDKRAWGLLTELYGGAETTIVREKFDIYHSPLVVDD